MRRIRTQRKVQRPKEDRNPVLPLDPRDPDVLKAKDSASPTTPRRQRAS